MKFAIFIDYDNLLPIHKTSGILDIVTRVLIQMPWDSSVTRGGCDIRIYGGWYEGAIMSQLAQEVVVAIQNDFPTVLRLPKADHSVAIMTNAELAVALLEEPTHHLFNTYRRRGKPNNIRVQSPQTVGCLDTSCPLPFTRKLLKTGKCPIRTCICPTDDLVYRHEQKIVDTMLACDLIYASRMNYDRIVLISGDDDFLPPLRTALLRGATVFRIHPQVGSQRASFPTFGTQYFEMEL